MADFSVANLNCSELKFPEEASRKFVRNEKPAVKFDSYSGANLNWLMNDELTKRTFRFKLLEM